MSTLDQFKLQTPQGVLYSLQEMMHNAQELLNKVESNAVLDAEDRERLKECIGSLRAFFYYAYPTLERVAYSRLDETELIRCDHLASLRDALQKSVVIAEERVAIFGSEIEQLRQRVDAWGLAARHPYI
jgi:hypothetical protein